MSDMPQWPQGQWGPPPHPMGWNPTPPRAHRSWAKVIVIALAIVVGAVVLVIGDHFNHQVASARGWDCAVRLTDAGGSLVATASDPTTQDISSAALSWCDGLENSANTQSQGKESTERIHDSPLPGYPYCLWHAHGLIISVRKTDTGNNAHAFCQAFGSQYDVTYLP